MERGWREAEIIELAQTHAVTFGGLFDPTLWDLPVSDVVSLTTPDDALPGTYVAAVKARRN